MAVNIHQQLTTSTAALQQVYVMGLMGDMPDLQKLQYIYQYFNVLLRLCEAHETTRAQRNYNSQFETTRAIFATIRINTQEVLDLANVLTELHRSLLQYIEPVTGRPSVGF